MLGGEKLRTVDLFYTAITITTQNTKISKFSAYDSYFSTFTGMTVPKWPTLNAHVTSYWTDYEPIRAQKNPKANKRKHKDLFRLIRDIYHSVYDQSNGEIDFSLLAEQKHRFSN